MTERIKTYSCNPHQAYRSLEDIMKCKPIVERETEIPYTALERADVDIYSGTHYGSWWELREFEACRDGAVFDSWFDSNYESASRCAESLNNIAGRGNYYVKLYRSNLIFMDYYSVERRSKTTDLLPY